MTCDKNLRRIISGIGWLLFNTLCGYYIYSPVGIIIFEVVSTVSSGLFCWYIVTYYGLETTLKSYRPEDYGDLMRSNDLRVIDRATNHIPRTKYNKLMLYVSYFLGIRNNTYELLCRILLNEITIETIDRYETTGWFHERADINVIVDIDSQSIV